MKGLGILLVLAAVAAAPTPTNEVAIDNFKFAAPTITVPVGATVTWTNRDDVPHNVVSTDKAFKSPVLDTDQRFSHTFETAGTFTYYCSLHPRMTGQIVVNR
jgi:amicyanin